MRPSAMRRCLFCNTPLLAGGTREHVFPKWILDRLGIRTAHISPTHFSPDGEVLSTRQHTLENVQEGRVCHDCNTGWMSRLENETRPLLLSVFDDARTVADLTHPERETVARWALKTV